MRHALVMHMMFMLNACLRYMAYVWHLNLSNDTSLPENKRKDSKDEALNILKAGIEANPSRYDRSSVAHGHTLNSKVLVSF